MAGATLDRELSTRFAVATRADDAALRRLLRENPMRGAVTVGLERESNYFRGTDLAGGRDQTIVAFADSRLVCMGRCTRRACWVEGQSRNVGYLAELRMDAAARGRFGILRDGYQFLHTLERDDPADLYFTSIAADNVRARRLLENGARWLPAYTFVAELDTLLLAVPRCPRAARLRLERASPARIPDLLRILNEHGCRHQLATVWTEETFRELESQDCPLDHFFFGIDGGNPVVCGALWDQRSFRQTVIRGYSRSLALARPFVDLTSLIFGTPRLPRVGSILANAFLSPLASVPGAEAILPDFVEAMFPLAAGAGVEFLTVALPTTDSRLPEIRRRFATRTWRSRLYQVEWADRPATTFSRERMPILPDVSLL